MNPTVRVIGAILTNGQTCLGRRGEGKESETVDDWIDLKLVGKTANQHKPILSFFSVFFFLSFLCVNEFSRFFLFLLF